MSKIVNIVEPTNYEEASKSDAWRDAMYEEIESINRNHTWDFVEFPEGKNTIGCKWLYKPKINVDGSIEKLKARLVAKGYSQQEGIDFDDTFAPVAKLNTIRMLISLATKHKWQLHQLDVKFEFLNGDLKEEIYLVQPEGNANNLIKEIKQQMSQVFEMKDLRNLHYCLGLEVWKDSRQTFLTQGKYARSLLERFRMEQCRSTATPLQQNLKLSSDDGTKEVDATMYKELVCSLIYLTTIRLELAYFVSVLSQFMSKPLESHWVAAENVLRYLSGTSNYGILYTDTSDVILVGFSDSNWAGNLDDQRSITGYAFSI
eukprot:PITA_21865